MNEATPPKEERVAALSGLGTRANASKMPASRRARVTMSTI